MPTHKKNLYIFISDENKNFYRATQEKNGSYKITFNKSPYPISYSPSNLLNIAFEFGTNQTYFSLNRTISYPLNFIKDGAAILRHLYYNGRGPNQKAYIHIFQWNGTIHELCYYGRIDFTQKKEDPKSGMFTASTIDDSAWGVLSQKDDIEYAIECNELNPKAIRVLLDNVNLFNKFVFQTVQAPIEQVAIGTTGFTMPFVLINQEGDSVGIITQDTELINNTVPAPIPPFFFKTIYDIYNTRISGSVQFHWESNGNVPTRIAFLIRRQGGGLGPALYTLYSSFGTTLIENKIYISNFDFVIPEMRAGSYLNLEMILEAYGPNLTNPVVVNIVSTNISVTTKTRPESRVVYALRPLDLMQQIVAKATGNRFTINSNFFEEHNKHVLTCGDAIRGVDNAKIYTSFKDFFKSFDCINFMALREINGALWMEKATEVYKNSGNFIDLGEVIDVKIEPAGEYFGNEISIGYPKVDLRHPSGRLEFNSTNTFSLDIEMYKKTIDVVSKYRAGCYDITFLLLDYQQESTTDNSGDKEVYLLDITDEHADGTDLVETFETVTIITEPLEPLINSPENNDLLPGTKPTLKGYATPSSTINVFADDILDGSTTADANGNWEYTLVTPLTPLDPLGPDDGVHTLKVSYTDLFAPFSTITVTIDTTNSPISRQIIYPLDGESLYNNRPLLKGVANPGDIVPIVINGAFWDNVTADGSGKWEFKTEVLLNGSHVLDITGDTSTFSVNSFVEFPLITFIERELDGKPIVENLPLIHGVAMPGTVVKVWLNYISYAPLGTVTADANGYWELQTVLVDYPDPITGNPVALTPIPNGTHVISTLLSDETVPVNVSGFKLNRPTYSPLIGVNDNTVFNVELSPKRMLRNRNPLWASILEKLPQTEIEFQTADKNSALVTKLGDDIVAERTDVPASILGEPLLRLEWITVTTKTQYTFHKTLQNFNNGGVVRASFRGQQLYMIPIGDMKMETITSDVQNWKLLLSPATPFSVLLNLYNNGLNIQLMNKSLYHSDYNSLHFVTYNYQRPQKYNHIPIYDDWFENRNEAWSLNPQYIQKFQRGDIIRDQIITNGVSGLFLEMYRCFDGIKVDQFNYQPVTPAPIPSPDIVLEAVIDLSTHPEDQYFFVLGTMNTDLVNVSLAISERIWTKDKWERTVLIEASNSINKTGCFFSSGFKSIIRVEGIVKKSQPSLQSIVTKDDIGDSVLLHSVVSRKRQIRFGTAYGLPDYLYLKIANALALDLLLVEGVFYVLEESENIEPSEDVAGHPLYYYNVNLMVADNPGGKAFPGAEPGSQVEGVVVVLDATAFGLPVGSLININLQDE